MTRPHLSVLAPVVVVLGMVPQTRAQPTAKIFVTQDGKRPSGLFCPGHHRRKNAICRGKRGLQAQGRHLRQGQELPGRNPQGLEDGRHGMNNVVQTYIYLEDHDQYAEVNKHYAEFFPSDPPLCTTLGVAQVPGDSRLEITCVAYADLAEKNGSATWPRTCRLVQGFWPAKRFTFQVKETSLRTGAILRRSKNRCGKRWATSRRSSSRLVSISGMSS